VFLLSCGSGVAALIYEIVWFQLLELVVGTSTVSVTVILATFMGGTCLGSLLFPRVISTRWNPLRVYALLELGIGVCGLLVLLMMPLAPGGAAAAIWLVPPTVLMGATLPALSRRADAVSLGYLYAGNIVGAVFGCLLAGFYLLREHDVAIATYFAVAVNAAVAVIAAIFLESGPSSSGRTSRREAPVQANHAVYLTIALSGLCAIAAETVWTRILALLLGGSVYTFSIIVAVFLFGLGLGSGAGSLLSRNLLRPVVR
jgi:spermidine synthase